MMSTLWCYCACWLVFHDVRVCSDREPSYRVCSDREPSYRVCSDKEPSYRVCSDRGPSYRVWSLHTGCGAFIHGV